MKTIETRKHDRFKKLKGHTIAIHAAKKMDESAFFNESFLEKGVLAVQNLITFAALCRGSLVCTAKVSDAMWMPAYSASKLSEVNDLAMCDCADKFLLILDDIKPLKQRVPYRGRQGIFHVPDDIVADVVDLNLSAESKKEIGGVNEH
jgi:hypothetical protein